jgi:chaperone required for assembly of F1-ATPase
VRRFYKQAAAVPLSRQPRESGGGTDEWFGIALDGKPVRTPGRAELMAPARQLAEAIADEWNAQGETIDPRAMRLTGLANAAIDRIAPDPAAFAGGLAAYGESDLLYYRSDAPAALAARQAASWDPILAWAQQRYDAVFELATGVIHMPQPPETVERLAAALAARDPFALAGLSPLVTISGSLLTALALAEGAIGLDAAWAAATLDENWQAEQWGEDQEAAAALAGRRADFAAASRFLSLL